MNLHQNTLTLFQSGVGTGDDLLLGFPSNKSLISEGYENFKIEHRIKGYDGSKIINFHPRQNFTFTVKAEYLVEEMSDIGLISFDVFMMKPHNYKFKLKAVATDTSGVIYKDEWVLEGTIDRDTIVYTTIEFDKERFIPKNFLGIELPDSQHPNIEYKIENLIDNSIMTVCFDDNNMLSTGWKHIIAKTINKSAFEYKLEEYCRKDMVATTATEFLKIQRSDLNSIILEMWKYPDVESELSIDYSFIGDVSGNLIEWGIQIEMFAGMDFPYEHIITVNNPWIGDMVYQEDDFYHNLNAGSEEELKRISLTPYLFQEYDPAIHGPNELKTVSFNTNIAPNFMYLAPNYFIPGVDVYMVDEHTNELNYNHVIKKNMAGISAIGGYAESEILAEHIFDNKIFRLFKTKGRRGDAVNSYSARFHYEIMDLATYTCIYKDILLYSNEEIVGDDSSNLTNDFFVKTSNIYIQNNKMVLLLERVVDYLHKYDANDIDNTIVKYDIYEIEIDMLNTKNVATKILEKDFTAQISDLYNKIQGTYINEGKNKIYIVPSCESCCNKQGDGRIDVVYKELIGFKSKFDKDQSGTSFPDESYKMYYFRKDLSPVLIYEDSVYLPVLDWGDTYGVCSAESVMFTYFKVFDPVTMTTKYIGKEYRVADMSFSDIIFEFDGFIKVMSYKDYYLVMNLKGNDMVCLKVNMGILGTLILDEAEMENNGLVEIIPFDIKMNTSFTGPAQPPQPSYAQKNFKSWCDVEEIIKIMDYTLRNDSYISEDRFHYQYMNPDGSFLSTRSRGDVLDFIMNYNVTQIDFQDDRLVWFGITNHTELSGRHATYVFRAEMLLIGFETILDKAQVYNNMELNITELFEISYTDDSDRDWFFTDKFYKPDDDVWFDSFVNDGKVVMYNRLKDTLLTFYQDIAPIPRLEYINKLSYADYSIILPEEGYLIDVDDFQLASMMELKKTPINRIAMLREYMSSRKNVPVRHRYRQKIFHITIYNFDGIINTIEARYGVDMPYEPGDIAPFEVKSLYADFTGDKIIENKSYALITYNQTKINGEETFIIKAQKLADMRYFLEILEEFTFFPNPSAIGYYESSKYGPPVSINDSEYEDPIPDSAFTVLYIKDYADGDDLTSTLSYNIVGNKMTINNNLPPRLYTLKFENSTKRDVSVNKRDVLNKYLDANLFERPYFKKFQWPNAPNIYTFTIVSSDPRVKAYGQNNSLIYFTNYDLKSEEVPKLLKAVKIDGHTNTFIYWKDEDTKIAKVNNDYLRTFTDDTLCIEAVEENIIIKSNKYSNYQDGFVNGVDDAGVVIDSMMLSNEDFLLNNLTLEGRKDYEFKLKFTGIVAEIPSNIVGDPIYTVTVNNSVVGYEFVTAYADIGLDNKQTRQNEATIRFSSSYKTKINLSEEAHTKLKEYGTCSILNSQTSKEFIVPIDNPKFSSFYYDSGLLATTITVYIAELTASSENVAINIDFEKTLNTIDNTIVTSGMTEEDIWKKIVSVSSQAIIQLFVRATIVFPDQVSWSPTVNIGTYYLNNQEFKLLPNINEDIAIVSSDILSFATTPIPVDNSPIELTNEASGRPYTRVFFLDEFNRFTLVCRETLKVVDNNTLIASFEYIDKESVIIKNIENEVDFISGNLIKLMNPLEEETEVYVEYMIENSFAINIDDKKNRVLVDVHSNEEDAKFKINYSSDSSVGTNINANPLLSITRGFVQI